MAEKKELLDLSEGEKEKVLELTGKILDSVDFCRQMIADGKADLESVGTMMGLFESYFSELAPLVKYESALRVEREKRYEAIREANHRIHELEKSVGTQFAQNPEAVSAALRHYENVFAAWYQSKGFHYASEKTVSAYMIRYSFSPEVHGDAENCRLTSEKELFRMMRDKNGGIFGENTVWDLAEGSYRSEVLDTDKNRKLFVKLLNEAFPSAYVDQFVCRRNDYESFSLCPEIVVPFSDIVDLEKSILEAE